MSILAIRSNRRPETERLKNNKIAEFESDRSLLASEDVALQSCENLQTFVWLGTSSSLGVDAQCWLILSLVCPCLYIARVVRAKNKNEVYMEF